MKLPRIAVTMGDPAGVGPEICLDLLSDESVRALCVPIVFGDLEVLLHCAERLDRKLPELVYPREKIASADTAGVFDIGAISMADFTPGEVNAATGGAGYRYIIEAIDAALAGDVQAVATAPIHKEALRASGVSEPGHTEIFTNRTGTARSCMMLTSDVLTCSFVTVHVGLFEVPKLISEQRVYDTIVLTREAMKRIRSKEPRIAICGLNPHAGEQGLFGEREEERFIIPAIERVRAEGADVEGPLPPDTAFLDWRREKTDAFVCMYHDQGHIPLKALAFDKAINTTLGLPIVRTSVDHGTALDIAWQGKANSTSLREAVSLAARLAL